MACPFIVFFDTFTHTGHTQENFDCVRFKSGIQLLEFRILPFGCVVESNLSDEPIIGATNPASFDLSLYSNSRTNCVVLQNVASHHFDEKHGVSCVVLKDTVYSNFLLFRGRYSTLTVAVFGIPVLPINQSIPPGTNLSVPPPQLGLPVPPLIPEIPSGPSAVRTTDSPSFSQTNSLVPTESQFKWNPDNTDSAVQSSSTELGLQRTGSLPSLPTPFTQSDKIEDMTELQNVDSGGLYEDGEIQDVDYEEISSSEEIFSDGEDADLNEDTSQSVEPFGESDPRLVRCSWRFNPWTMAAKCSTGSSGERYRIPDPTFTLFQLHCWLLDRTERTDLGSADFQQTAELEERSEATTDTHTSNDTGALPPPLSDTILGSDSAQHLLTMSQKFPASLETPFHEDWVEAIDAIEPHLAPGLAFLYHTDKPAFQAVTEALIVWVYTGLDLAAALKQPNSAYISRHLLAGVRLTGLVTGTLCPRIAWPLLFPGVSALPQNLAHFAVFQVQHLLLNIIESPLVSTPLRLAVCRALDQSTRLPIGLDAFYGRHRAISATELVSSDSDLVLNTNDEKSVDENIALDAVEKSPPSETDSKSCNNLVNNDPSGCLKAEFGNDAQESHEDSLEEPSPQVTIRTPYQRLIILFSSTKNARLISSYQRLINKLHAYELLLEFHSFIDTLRALGDSSVITLDSEQKLIYYINQITGLLRNADEIITNPRNALPCPILLEDPNPAFNQASDLCAMLDDTNFLNDLVWICEQLQPSTGYQSHDHNGFVSDSMNASVRKRSCPVSPRDTINVRLPFTWSCVRALLSALLSEVYTLTLLASRPESTSAILNLLLNSVSDCQVRHGSSLDMLVMGLELAYKMETLRYLDVLIDWARKKGVTGTLLTTAQLLLSADGHSQTEPLLHEGLFGLARLCTSCLGASRFSSHDTGTSDTVKSILSSAGSIWVAQVISLDDHFVPFLMLLEAFSYHETRGSQADKSKDSEATDKAGTDSCSVSEAVSAPVIRLALRQLVSSPIDPSTLVNAIVLTVLRHSESVTYLDRYGSRMANLVSNYMWEESLNDSAALNLVTSIQSFSRTGAPFLYWLRDCPTRLSVQTLQALCESSVLSSQSFAWLLSRLKPLGTELEEALNELLSIETSDELLSVSGSTNVNSAPRKQGTNQNVFAGRPLPPALLLLLRLLRARVCDSSGDGASRFRRPERQICLSRSLALIELFSSNGLHQLSSLIEKLTNFFMLHCQATVYPSSSELDLIGVSSMNSNVTLIMDLLDCAVHIVTQILITVLGVQGGDFRDMTPVRALFEAYACTVYFACPPGPKLNQAESIRKAVIAGLLAYTNTDGSASLSVKEIEKSLWVSVCRQLITFTISAPMFCLPGLKIILDLLPLPLPIYTVNSLDEASQRRIRSTRDRWAAHLFPLLPEFSGLVELLAGTEPVPSNPLYSHVLQLIQRLADLGLPCAVSLATSCLNALFTAWKELLDTLRRKSTPSENTAGSDGDQVNKLGQASRMEDLNLNTETTHGDQVTAPLRTAGCKLLLSTLAGLSTSSDNISFDSPRREAPPHLNSVTVEADHQTPFENCFDELDNVSELTAALSFLYVLLQVPSCRFAVTYLLQSNPTSAGKTFDDGCRSYVHQFVSTARQMLLAYSDKPGHIRAQLLFLKCIGLLLHTELALNGFDPVSHVRSADETSNDRRPEDRLAEGLPDTKCLEELVSILLEHISHLDRDMATLPSALLPLLYLTQHDAGFLLIRDALNTPAASRVNGQHFFGNMVQRVNDCFSTENPDCQATLAMCLRLLQSLFVGRTTLPITFAADHVSGDNTDSRVLSMRSLHISGARVRAWLGWSAGGDEGKPVRDLHALLEMLTDDEPSLEYLRGGMKNLLSLLSEEFDIPECEHSDTATSVSVNRRSIEEIFAVRPMFVTIADPISAEQRITTVQQILRRLTVGEPVTDCVAEEILFSSDITPSPIPCNLAELASTYCGGLNILDELSKIVRQQESAEAAIRHQKRRRGQSSIIETGRTSKKFVAPMRGRGFILRGSSAQSHVPAGLAGSSLGVTGTAGSRGDLFRSRPLNTSRPPSLHVDDFTKLVKEDSVIEEPSRTRSYRDTRSSRGRGQRSVSSRGSSSSHGLSTNIPFGLGLSVFNPLGVTPLLPNWPTPSRPLPLLPLALDHRNVQLRRDRPSR